MQYADCPASSLIKQLPICHRDIDPSDGNAGIGLCQYRLGSVHWFNILVDESINYNKST